MRTASALAVAFEMSSSMGVVGMQPNSSVGLKAAKKRTNLYLVIGTVATLNVSIFS